MFDTLLFTRQVKTLSGGQQRRVSLAAALIHQPELVILDEPTAGVDPVLRQSIWDHLVEITKGGRTTVIITTHYIDETKQANVIGLMRGGRFLAEEAPGELMRRYQLRTRGRIPETSSSAKHGEATPIQHPR
ncbi:ABC transporter G family member 23-like [Choristoneura fumiferana]|uniref:ABC transporter G family member 23-like n=1 Tax=Choristoneura fumiferana TaxID=7141 RepID=UPI003D159E61